MAIYSVLLPPGSRTEAPVEADLERAVFVKEGFCWPALFFSAIWSLWHRLWLVLIGYLVIVLMLEATSRLVGGIAPGVTGLLFALLFALEANGLRRWTLERRGWQPVAMVEGSNREAAEVRFFAGLAGRDAARPPVSPSPVPPSPARPAPASAPRIGGEQVVGLSFGPHRR